MPKLLSSTAAGIMQGVGEGLQSNADYFRKTLELNRQFRLQVSQLQLAIAQLEEQRRQADMRERQWYDKLESDELERQYTREHEIRLQTMRNDIQWRMNEADNASAERRVSMQVRAQNYRTSVIDEQNKRTALQQDRQLAMTATDHALKMMASYVSAAATDSQTGKLLNIPALKQKLGPEGFEQYIQQKYNEYAAAAAHTVDSEYIPPYELYKAQFVNYATQNVKAYQQNMSQYLAKSEAERRAQPMFFEQVRTEMQSGKVGNMMFQASVTKDGSFLFVPTNPGVLAVMQAAQKQPKEKRAEYITEQLTKAYSFTPYEAAALDAAFAQMGYATHIGPLPANQVQYIARQLSTSGSTSTIDEQFDAAVEQAPVKKGTFMAAATVALKNEDITGAQSMYSQANAYANNLREQYAHAKRMAEDSGIPLTESRVMDMERAIKDAEAAARAIKDMIVDHILEQETSGTHIPWRTGQPAGAVPYDTGVGEQPLGQSTPTIESD